MYNIITKSYDEAPPCTLDKEYNNFVKSISYGLIGDFLSIEECDTLIKLGDSNKLTLGLDRAGYKSVNRESLISFIPNSDLKWLVDKLTTKIEHINNQYQKWDLTHLDRFQYTTYEVDGYLSHHNDDYFDYIVAPECPEKDLLIRKLSISILLSDPEEYSGGEFEIQTPKGVINEPYDIQLLKPKKGTLIMFPSFCIHKVHPILSGRRVALVAWFFGPKWK